MGRVRLFPHAICVLLFMPSIYWQQTHGAMFHRVHFSNRVIQQNGRLPSRVRGPIRGQFDKGFVLLPGQSCVSYTASRVTPLSLFRVKENSGATSCLQPADWPITDRCSAPFISSADPLPLISVHVHKQILIGSFDTHPAVRRMTDADNKETL